MTDKRRNFNFFLEGFENFEYQMTDMRQKLKFWAWFQNFELISTDRRHKYDGKWNFERDFKLSFLLKSVWI